MLRYGIPYGSSTIVAFLAAGWLESSHGSFSATLAILLLENIAFYLVAVTCDRFFLPEDQLFSSGEESLKQLVLLELIDGTVRWILLWLAPRVFPENPELATGAASLLADILFIIALNRSRRLVELVNTLIRESREVVSFNPLGLANSYSSVPRRKDPVSSALFNDLGAIIAHW